MAKLGIYTGTTPNDGTGDTLLTGAIKINSNFNEIYSYFGDGTNLIPVGYATSSGIATYATTAGVATYSSTSGIATYATTAGVATYSSTSGIATSVVGGIASVTSLNVSGVSTLSALNVGTGGTIVTTFSSGNVGIATTNPQSTLHVQGDLQVTGSVKSSSIVSYSIVFGI